jgi:hypothetical protein
MPLHKDGTAMLAGALRARSVVTGNVPLRSDSSGCGRLCGTLLVAGGSPHGKLLINGVAMERVTEYQSGIALAPGPHLLAWLDDNGRMQWREKIQMLPFETKIVSVAAAQHN